MVGRGHRPENNVRYLGFDVENALEIAAGTED